MRRPEVSVVMPARNEGARLRGAIRSIVAGRSCAFPLEIVVVDDASTDNCCQGLQGVAAESGGAVEVSVIRCDRWSGIPRARNVGASRARGAILFITDANVEFPRNWDLSIRRQFRDGRALCATIADKAASFLGYGCNLEVPSMGVRWLPNPYVFGGAVPISPCTGTVIAQELFRRCGGYDEGMPLYGAAEPEFSVRLWLMGGEIVTAPDLVLRHRFRPASERAPFLRQIRRVLTHNYIRFGMLYLDANSLARTLRFYERQDPAGFAAAARLAGRRATWCRRQALLAALAHPFASYAERFAPTKEGRVSPNGYSRMALP